MSSAVIPMSTIVVSWRCSRIEPRRDIVPECSIGLGLGGQVGTPRGGRSRRCRVRRFAHVALATLAPLLPGALRSARLAARFARPQRPSSADGGEPRVVWETRRGEIAQAAAGGPVAGQL